MLRPTSALRKRQWRSGLLGCSAVSSARVSPPAGARPTPISTRFFTTSHPTAPSPATCKNDVRTSVVARYLVRALWFLPKLAHTAPLAARGGRGGDSVGRLIMFFLLQHENPITSLRKQL